MPTIKPIETRYAGCRFRSRLEARCAVFLDTLGAQWEYEPEGFQLQSGWYLPDFRVNDPAIESGHFWIECKPSDPYKEVRRAAPPPGWPVGSIVEVNVSRDLLLARELSGATCAAVGFFTPQLLRDLVDFAGRYVGDPFWWEIFGEPWMWPNVQFWDRPSVIDRSRHHCVYDCLLPRIRNGYAVAAAAAARSARFEHGECGAR
jgi:hypothetical protein